MNEGGAEEGGVANERISLTRLKSFPGEKQSEQIIAEASRHRKERKIRFPIVIIMSVSLACHHLVSLYRGK